jgi:chaperonin GroEL (HSP60 family)
MNARDEARTGGISGFARLTADETGAVIGAAAEEMGSLVRSTLGPFGLDKLVVRRQDGGELRVFASNDGVAIIEEFESETDHPVAEHFIKTAEAQEDEYGDGTTTTILLASELVSAGVDLVEQGVPPTAIVEGFSMAAQRSLETWGELSVPLTTPDGRDYDRELLEAIAKTGMTNGSDTSWPLNGLSDVVVDAVLRVAEPEIGRADLSFVRTEAMPGGGVGDSRLIRGGLLPREPVRESVALPVEGPVLLVEGDVEPREFEGKGAVSGEAGDGLRQFEERQYERLAAAIEAAGAVAVLATGNVSRELAVRLAGKGIVAAQNVKETRIEFLSRAIGSAVSPPLVSPDVVPTADRLRRARVSTRRDQSGTEWIQVVSTEDVDSTAVTLLVRGGGESVAGEAERRIKDGLNAVRAAVMRPEALPGGGAAEVAAAAAVRDLAPSIGGRAQLAMEAYADALESVPRTLARNAGLDPIEATLDLRTRHHGGDDRAGIAASGAVVDDVVREEGLDPQLVRTSALVRSTELANSYARIDSILYSETPVSPVDGELSF